MSVNSELESITCAIAQVQDMSRLSAAPDVEACAPRHSNRTPRVRYVHAAQQPPQPPPLLAPLPRPHRLARRLRLRLRLRLPPSPSPSPPHASLAPRGASPPARIERRALGTSLSSRRRLGSPPPCRHATSLAASSRRAELSHSPRRATLSLSLSPPAPLLSRSGAPLHLRAAPHPTRAQPRADLAASSARARSSSLELSA